MSSDLKHLLQKIQELEKENKSLKEKVTDSMGFIDFDFLFDAIRQPMFLLEKKGGRNINIVKANKSASELVKYEPDELLQVSPLHIGLFGSHKEFMDCAETLKKHEHVSIIAKVKTKADQTISSEITLYRFPKKDEDYYIVFQRNIGSHQKVVEALRQSEFRFLQMAENVLEGIIIAEEDKPVFINSSMSQITGYSKDELRQMDELDFARDDEKDRIKSFREKLMDSPAAIHAIEFWIKTKMGVEKYIKNNYTYSQRADGKKNTYIITSDITARKRIEEALRKSQNDFRMLADNSPDIITRYSKDLTYTYANQSLEQITGIPVSQFIGRNNLEIDLEPDLVSFLEEMHLEVFRTGRTLKFEFRLQKKHELKIFQSNMVPELSPEGMVNSVLNVSRDITQIKQVEKELKTEKKNIIVENHQLGENLEEWCNKLCSSNNKTQRDMADNCLQPIMQIARWAKYGHTNHEISPKNIIVNKLVKKFYDEKTEKPQNANVEISLFLPAYELSVYADPELIIESLELIFENAVEATQQGKIEIGFDIYNEHEIVFFVKDTGVGMDPEVADRVFTPFYSHSKSNHAGLGLSIAKKFVQVMQGKIWCLSSPGTGSTFCFTHPAKVEQSLLQAKSDTQGGKWANKWILIVEDTDNNYLLLESIFNKLKPKLTRAVTGDEAIKTIQENPGIDLILMDIQLPGITGLEATQKIRKFNKDVPIIAQTAYAMYDDVVKALDAGCNDFVAKPIKTKKLISLIEKYLD